MKLLILVLLACAACAARMRPDGSSEYLDQCASVCEDRHRELLGIKESDRELRCFCGKRIPEQASMP